jgi:hypothetical protein
MGLFAASAGFLDPQGGLMAGFQNGLQGYQNAIATNQHRQQLSDQQAVRQAFADFAQPDANGNVDPTEVFKRMMGSGNPALVQFALANAPKRTVKSTLKVLDENGVPRHQVLFSDGTEGAMINAPAAERMAFEDMGGVKAGLNPFTGEVLRQFQKSPTPDSQAQLAQSAQQFAQRMAMDQSQFNQRMGLDTARFNLDRNPDFLMKKAQSETFGRESAKNLVDAQAGLGQTLETGQQMIDAVKQTVNHPGFDFSVGNPVTSPLAKVAAFVPGTESASFKANMDQLLGKQFLQAYESLRGAGAITVVETEQATKSLSRMQTANTKEDFIKSANELIDIVQRGMNRARQKAGQQPAEFKPSNLSVPTSGKKSAITPNMFSVEER